MDKDLLLQKMMLLPEPTTGLKPPHWEYWRHDLWQRIVKGENPNGFMGWPCVFHTMLVNHWKDAVDWEFKQLDIKWEKALNAPPMFYPFDFYADTHYSMNLIHQAYHLQRWEEATGRDITKLKVIVEFGGGYGAMALLCKRMGFDGRYFIYDFPEFCLLQQYVLSKFAWKKVAYCVDRVRKVPKRADLLIALYSLSETPYEKRGEFLQRVGFDSCLFLYTGKWADDLSNTEFFSEVGMFASMDHWHHTELTHLPDKNNWYDIGWKDA